MNNNVGVLEPVCAEHEDKVLLTFVEENNIFSKGIIICSEGHYFCGRCLKKYSVEKTFSLRKVCLNDPNEKIRYK